MPHEISSALHFRTLTNSTTHVIADFYATWCPPCKAIAPLFNQLSSASTTPGSIQFAKINVDEQREVAGQYGITAMPTFLVFKDGKVVETIRGADAKALKRVVEGIEGDVKKAKAEESKKVESVEDKVGGSTETVSGSYGMTKGSGWKMAL